MKGWTFFEAIIVLAMIIAVAFVATELVVAAHFIHKLW